MLDSAGPWPFCTEITWRKARAAASASRGRCCAICCACICIACGEGISPGACTSASMRASLRTTIGPPLFETCELRVDRDHCLTPRDVARRGRPLERRSPAGLLVVRRLTARQQDARERGRHGEHRDGGPPHVGQPAWLRRQLQGDSAALQRQQAVTTRRATGKVAFYLDRGGLLQVAVSEQQQLIFVRMRHRYSSSA